MSKKSEAFIAYMDKFINYYESAKKCKPESLRVKTKDKNLIWPILTNGCYKGVRIDFV